MRMRPVQEGSSVTDDIPVRRHRRPRPATPWAITASAVVSIIGLGMAIGALLGWLMGGR